MATLIKLLLLVLIVFWIGRFFSASLDRLWRGTIGAALAWVRLNGTVMMRWMFALAALLAVLVFFQWR